jgi:hypothetical protein
MRLILRDAGADRSLSSTLVRVMNFRLPVFTFVTCARGARNSQLIAESFFHGSAKAPSLDQQASNQGRTPRYRPNANIGTEKPEAIEDTNCNCASLTPAPLQTTFISRTQPRQIPVIQFRSPNLRRP